MTASIHDVPDAQKTLARFDAAILGDRGLAAVQHQREAFKLRAENILCETKPSREQALALTALEEALFWTNKAIAMHGHVPDPAPLPSDYYFATANTKEHTL